jgi:hypothetical protein
MQGRQKIDILKIMETINKWSDTVKAFVHSAYLVIKSPNEAIDRMCRHRLHKSGGQINCNGTVKVTIKGFGIDDVPWTKKVSYVNVAL